MHDTDLVDTEHWRAGPVVYARCSCGWESGRYKTRHVAQLAADHHTAAQADEAYRAVHHG